IGPALNLAPAYPAEDGADAQVTLADGVENRLYLDPILRGRYPDDAPQFLGDGPWEALGGAIKEGDLALIGAPIDVMGVNYYNPVVINSRGSYVTKFPTSIAEWEQIYPDGLHDILVRLSRDYTDRPLLITENGIPNEGSVTPVDGVVADPERID